MKERNADLLTCKSLLGRAPPKILEPLLHVYRISSPFGRHNETREVTADVEENEYYQQMKDQPHFEKTFEIKNLVSVFSDYLHLTKDFCSFLSEPHTLTAD